MDRRELLRGGLAAGAVALGGSLWRDAAAGTAPVGPGVAARRREPVRRAKTRRAGNQWTGYGPLREAGNGLRLPDGFTSRVLARSGAVVGSTGYVWHGAPDGGAVFPTPTGGWIYVSNSELRDGAGGAGAIRFSADGTMEAAYRILGGTSINCAGGAMPWGTWLSCEEHPDGQVWECDPTGARPAVARPAMGRFSHEAAAADAARGVVYLTEDQPDGAFYRFRPTAWGDLSRGALEVLCRRPADGVLHWAGVPDPAGRTRATRSQVADALRFQGGEGIWFARGTCYFTTKGDGRVWAYDAGASTLRVLYDASTAVPLHLTGVDNVTMAPGHRLFVAEDGGDMQVCVVSLEGKASPFLQVVGHDGSEVTGVAFDPAGDRLYLSSQRGASGAGVTWEVTGPF